VTVKTYSEQLEEVQAAISAIMTGAQSYGIAGRSVTRGDLTTLLAEEKHLRMMVKRETAGGISIYGGTPVDA